MLETDAGCGRRGGGSRRALWFGLQFVLVLLLGCASTGSSRLGSHAAITIKGHGVTDVVLTTREVFNNHGYRLAHAEPDRMIFERPGTKGEQLKYGSFGSSAVVIRVKVDIQEMGSDTFLLQANVFSVRDAGQSVLEDETRLMLMSAKPYQSMLDEVKARLDSPTGSVDTGSQSQL